MALPSDARNPAPRIVISGKGEVMIGGRVTLCEYTPEAVGVQRTGSTVRILGQSLTILSMDDMGICVAGAVDSITFVQ